MDPSSRNILILIAVVAVLYYFCTQRKEQFLASAPFDGPVDDDAVVAPVAAAAPGAAASMSPMPAVAAAAAAEAAWQSGARSINPSATNFVDSRAMDGIDSTGGWTRKNSTWDVRGAVPIQRDPSVSFYGISSRMPPPPTNNKVFCSTS